MNSLGHLFRFLNRTDGSLAAKTARSFVWVGTTNALNNTIRFAGQIVVARLLLPEQIGLMGIALFFLRVLDVLSQPGLSAAIIHRTDRVKQAVDAAWSALILRGLVLAGLMFAVSPLVARFYDQPALTEIIRVISVIYVIQGLTNSYLIVLRKELDFKHITQSEVAATLLQLAATVAVAFQFRSVWALVVGQLVLAGARTAASFMITRKRPRFSLHWPLMKELFGYGKFVTGTTIVGFLTNGIDKAVAGKILGMAPLGHYVYAQSLADLPATSSVPVVQRILFPTLSKLQTRLPRLRAAYVQMLRLVVAITLPMSVGIVVLAREIVATIYGDNWLPMVGAVYVLSAFCVLRILSGTTYPVFLALGQPQVGFHLSVAKLTLIAILIYPLTTHHGIVGTALSITVPAAIEQLLLWWLAARALDSSVGLLAQRLWRLFVAAAIMAVVVLLLKQQLTTASDRLVLATSVAVGALTYLGSLAALDRRIFVETSEKLRLLLDRRD